MSTTVMRALLVLLVSFALTAGFADDLRFDSSDPAKTPLTVPLSKIEGRINGDPSADGAEFKISVAGKVMHIDLIAIPGSTSVAAVMRCIFIIGRLAKPDYDEMRFTDQGEDIFLIDGATIRGIGAQFLWGEKGGQNPIHLIRLFADGLRYANGSRVISPLTGSLMGDTSRSVKAINEVFHPKWTLKTTKLK